MSSQECSSSSLPCIRPPGKLPRARCPSGRRGRAPCIACQPRRAPLRFPYWQGEGGIYLAGAWCGYGFHEDGIKSAVAVVEAMGGSIPWVPRTVSPKIGLLDKAGIALFDKFAKSAIKVGAEGRGHEGLPPPAPLQWLGRSFGGRRRP